MSDRAVSLDLFLAVVLLTRPASNIYFIDVSTAKNLQFFFISLYLSL